MEEGENQVAPHKLPPRMRAGRSSKFIFEWFVGSDRRDALDLEVDRDPRIQCSEKIKASICHYSSEQVTRVPMRTIACKLR